MASGRLGSADLSATTETTIYTVAASTLAVCSVSICNRGAVAATIRLAIADDAAAEADKWILYGYVIDPGGFLERTGLVLAATQRLNAYSDVANTSWVAYGYEEAV